MSDIFLLDEAQMTNHKPIFQCRMESPALITDAPFRKLLFKYSRLYWQLTSSEYSPAKTLSNRQVRWNRKGIFACTLKELSREWSNTDVFMRDAACINARWTVPSLPLKKWRQWSSYWE